MYRYADISECETYRYSLVRTWRASDRFCLWIMANPSTADGREDDATIRRCISFSERFGCGSLEVVNLFAYRTKSPEVLFKAWGNGEPVIGPRNDEYISSAILRAHLIVCAWGACPVAGDFRYTVFWQRTQFVRDTVIAKNNGDASCLGLTKYNEPRHPLYMKADTELERW